MRGSLLAPVIVILSIWSAFLMRCRTNAIPEKESRTSSSMPLRHPARTCTWLRFCGSGRNRFSLPPRQQADGTCFRGSELVSNAAVPTTSAPAVPYSEHNSASKIEGSKWCWQGLYGQTVFRSLGKPAISHGTRGHQKVSFPGQENQCFAISPTEANHTCPNERRSRSSGYDEARPFKSQARPVSRWEPGWARSHGSIDPGLESYGGPGSAPVAVLPRAEGYPKGPGCVPGAP